MQETIGWSLMHRRELLADFKKFKNELNRLRKPKVIFAAAEDEKSNLNKFYKELITSFKKIFTMTSKNPQTYAMDVPNEPLRIFTTSFWED